MLFLWHVSRVLEGGIKMQDRSSLLCHLRQSIGMLNHVQWFGFQCMQWRHTCFCLV